MNISKTLNREYKPTNIPNVDQKKDALMSEGNTNKKHKTISNNNTLSLRRANIRDAMYTKCQ